MTTSAACRARIDRQELRRARHLGRHGHQPATGPAAEKPAFWVDGNIHATEVAASAATLYFLQTLVTQYGKDADVTRALDTRAFYLCPRINPDGAEWALADKPKWIRSSTRPYPYDEEEIEGLTVEDIDGDGRILQMRMRDPNGLWKDHPQRPVS